MNELDDKDRLEILRAGDRDLSGICRLARVVWHAHYPGIISREQIDYMLDRMLRPTVLAEQIQAGMCYEILKRNGHLIGFAAHGPTAEAGTWKLDKLYLLPRHQGSGLGSMLLRHVLHIARERGKARLELAVNKRNHRAIRVYVRNGFEITRSVVTDIGNGFLMDDHIMTCRLDGAPT